MAITIPNHAIQLFGIACLARNRARQSASTSPDSEHTDASVAIVMAAASAEGLMNELAEVSSPRFFGDDLKLATLGKVLDEIERGRGATTFKYLMASLLLSGTMFDRGARPYQDLELLFKVRNQYMHLPVPKQQGSTEGDGSLPMPALTQLFQNRGLARPSPGGGVSWMAVMQTPEMAAWACQAASDAMIAILDMIPMGPLVSLGWKSSILAHLESTAADV